MTEHDDRISERDRPVITESMVQNALRWAHQKYGGTEFLISDLDELDMRELFAVAFGFLDGIGEGDELPE